MRLIVLAFLMCSVCACASSTSAPGAGDPATAGPSPAASATPPVSCAPPYPTVATAETVFCADPASLEAAQVVRIVDGDTIHVVIDGVDETVRFYGIDTAERGQACFREATDRTRELVGDEVLLRRDARNQDRYRRLLRYVYTPEGLSIDATLVAEGLAYAWREDGVLRGSLIALEALAQGLHRGCLWQKAG